MMRDGGHLAVYDNHDALRREIARHSRRDAEAYDRYVRDMLRHCRFIKPLLLRAPPDPTSFKPRDLRELLFLGGHFHSLGEARMYDTLRFFTMSCADMLEEYFESEIVKAHLCGSSIIGTALGPRSPGTAYVLLHHYMGSIDGAVGAWGFARGGMGAITQALAASLRASGGTMRTERAGGADPGAQRPRHGRGARGRRGDRGAGRGVEPRREAHLPRDAWHPSTCPEISRAGAQASRSAAPPASSTSRSTACRSFPAIPQGSPATRGDMHVTDTLEMVERAYDDWKEGRWSRAAVRRHADPLADRSHHGARRQALHVGVRAVLSVPARRGRVDAGEAPGLRRYRHRCDRAPQSGLQGPHPARRDPHALGYRERSGPHRGQHLPGRAHLRSAAVQPSDPRLRAVPRAAARHVHVRLEHPSGRRRHGRARAPTRPTRSCAISGGSQ